jgi:pyrroline-5-carboxylate reductase
MRRGDRIVSSGPAYFFLLAELMADAAVNLGPDRAAHRTRDSDMFGSGLMARDSDGSGAPPPR